MVIFFCCCLGLYEFFGEMECFCLYGWCPVFLETITGFGYGAEDYMWRRSVVGWCEVTKQCCAGMADWRRDSSLLWASMMLLILMVNGAASLSSEFLIGSNTSEMTLITTNGTINLGLKVYFVFIKTMLQTSNWWKTALACCLAFLASLSLFDVMYILEDFLHGIHIFIVFKWKENII